MEKEVKNWLGHDIVEGATVFRGGKQNDNSTFRVGVVDNVTEEKAKARVVWHWEGSLRTVYHGVYRYDDPNRYVVPGPHKSTTRTTVYGINELVRVEDSMLEYLEKRDELIKTACERDVREHQFADFEREFMAGNIPY